MYVKARWGREKCPLFGGGRFSEGANVLQKRNFQSLSATLSAVYRDCVHFSECPLREVLLYP